MQQILKKIFETWNKNLRIKPHIWTIKSKEFSFSRNEKEKNIRHCHEIVIIFSFNRIPTVNLRPWVT